MDNSIHPEQEIRRESETNLPEICAPGQWTAQRECRDVIFLLIFGVFCGGMVYTSVRGYLHGNPFRIIYGVDSWGNVCNQNNDVITGIDNSKTGLNLSGKKYLFYFNEAMLLSDSSGDNLVQQSVRICVKSCPSTKVNDVTDLRRLADQSGNRLCVYDVEPVNYVSGHTDGRSTCPPLPIVPHDVFLFLCVPSTISTKLDHIQATFTSMFDSIDDNLLEKSANDIKSTWFEIFILCIVAVVVSLLLSVLLQLLAAIVIWVTVVAVVLGTLGAMGACWYHYLSLKKEHDAIAEEDRTPHLEHKIRDWLIGSIAVSILTVIILLLLLALRKHIALVITLFQEAGKAIRCMPSLLFLPLLTLVILVSTLATLAYILLCLVTAGIPSVDDTTGYVRYNDDNILKYLKWYYIFGIIWIAEFILACHQLTVAGAVVTWFFSRDKSSISLPVIKTVGRIIRYQLGSIAIGSFVLALVVLVRMVLSFIENRLKGREHPVAMFLLKCFKCCLWCFEKFLKFLNTNAYIEIAIHGYSFCKAAREAFSLILKNTARVATINYVGDFVLFLGKVATVTVVIATGIELISSRTDVNYVWLPPTLAGIFAYIVSSCFMSVYEMTIDTIFVCFCEDSSMNNGEDRPYFMSVALMKYMSSGVRNAKNKVEPLPDSKD